MVLESYCQVCRSGHSSVIPVSPVFTLGSRALSTGSPVTNSPNFSLLKNVFIFYIFIGNRTFKGQLFFLSPPCPRRLSASAPSAARSLVGLIVAPSEPSSPPPPRRACPLGPARAAGSLAHGVLQLGRFVQLENFHSVLRCRCQFLVPCHSPPSGLLSPRTEQQRYVHFRSR